MPDFHSVLGAVSHTGPTMDAPRVIAGEESPTIAVCIEECLCGAADRAGSASGAFCGLESVPHSQEDSGKQRDFPGGHVKGPQVLLEEGDMIQSSMGKKIS